MTPDERMGITSVSLFPSLIPDDFAPPQGHGKMGLTHAFLIRFILFIDYKVEILMDEDKEASS
jgi:hypothetical protein